MTKTAMFAALLFSVPALAQEQTATPLEPANLLELRGSSTQYRYADFTHTSRRAVFGRPLVVEATYIGGQGYNEANAGAGLLFKLGRSVTLIPLAYATADAKASQTGVKFGLAGAFERGAWKSSLYLAQFCRIGRDTPNYLVLDTADVTRKITGRWEAGISTGFLRQSGKWNPQYGPTVRWNGWSASCRFGSGGRELRFGRVFTF